MKHCGNAKGTTLKSVSYILSHNLTAELNLPGHGETSCNLVSKQFDSARRLLNYGGRSVKVARLAVNQKEWVQVPIDHP